VPRNDNEPAYFIANHHNPEIAKVLFDQPAFTIRRNPDYGIIISGQVGNISIDGEAWMCPEYHAARRYHPEIPEVLYDEAGFTVRRDPTYGVILSGVLTCVNLGEDAYLCPSPRTHARHED
jgi:hypothetical protein